MEFYIPGLHAHQHSFDQKEACVQIALIQHAFGANRFVRNVYTYKSHVLGRHLCGYQSEIG